MIYDVQFTDDFEDHLAKHIKAGNKQLVRKIDSIIVELAEHPRTGTGKPEPLKYRDGDFWSRRLDQKHRLVYEIRDAQLLVVAVSTYGHYGDK